MSNRFLVGVALNRLADRQEAAVGQPDHLGGAIQDDAANRAIMGGFDIDLDDIIPIVDKGYKVATEAIRDGVPPDIVIPGQWMHGFHFGLILAQVLKQNGKL